MEVTVLSFHVKRGKVMQLKGSGTFGFCFISGWICREAGIIPQSCFLCTVFSELQFVVSWLKKYF